MNDFNSPQQENKKKLYVGNLPWSMTEEDVRAMCEPYGELESVNLITFADSGRSRGFAFVEFVDEESAQRAIDALHDNEVEGRKLFVKIAQPKREDGDRPRRSFGGNRGGYGGNRGGGSYGNNRGGDRRGGYGGSRGGYRSDRNDRNSY